MYAIARRRCETGVTSDQPTISLHLHLTSSDPRLLSVLSLPPHPVPVPLLLSLPLLCKRIREVPVRDERERDLDGDERNDDELHAVGGALGQERAQDAHEVLGVVELLIERAEARLDVQGEADGVVVLWWAAAAGRGQ